MQATPVLNILGLLLALLACTMLIPMGIDLYYNDPNWQAFAVAALMTGFIGGSYGWPTGKKTPLIWG